MSVCLLWISDRKVCLKNQCKGLANGVNSNYTRLLNSLLFNITVDNGQLWSTEKERGKSGKSQGKVSEFCQFVLMLEFC